MTERQYGRVFRMCLLFASGLLGFLFLRYCAGRVLSVLFPFVFAYLFARLTLYPARFFARKTRIPVRVWAIGLTLLLFSLFGAGIFFLVRRLILESGEILSGVLSDPGLPSRIAATVERVVSFILSRVPGGAGGPLLSEEDLAGIFRDALLTLVGSASRVLGGFLSRIPSFLLSLFVSVVAAVWFSADPEATARVFRALPPVWRRRAERIGRGLVRGAKTVFFAYGVLFLLTFLILTAGLALLGVPYALLLSLLIALFDLLPVLGAGGILIPWGIVSVLSGRAAFGICVLFLSLVIFTVRQIVTPRLVGRGLGARPLLVFFLVFAGLKLAGAPGMLAGLLLSVPLSRAIDRRSGAPDTE